MPSRKRLIGTTRLSTGLILFFYVLTHDLNHALGLISLNAMETGRVPFLAFWHFLPIRIVFYLSILLHMLIALYALYQRRSLRMPGSDACQLALGLILPPLLVLHVVGTAVANSLFDLHATYRYVVWSLWIALPAYGVIQAVNTYEHHEKTVRRSERAERNMLRTISGDFGHLDTSTWNTLQGILDGAA